MPCVAAAVPLTVTSEETSSGLAGREIVQQKQSSELVVGAAFSPEDMHSSGAHRRGWKVWDNGGVAKCK
jgi:hypothetical protein